MKLSEKLAALEDDEEHAPAPANASATSKSRGAKAHAPAPAKPHSTWEASKRKVRDLVLADLAPRMASLEGDSLRNEVKACVDKFLTREDVKIGPA
jgi:hypothetical protein